MPDDDLRGRSPMTLPWSPRSLTRNAALDCAGSGFRLNAVCPGVIRIPLIMRLTPERQGTFAGMIPLRRMREPHEIVNIVTWLCSARSSFVAGALIAADGGMTAH